MHKVCKLLDKLKRLEAAMPCPFKLRKTAQNLHCYDQTEEFRAMQFNDF